MVLDERDSWLVAEACRYALGSSEPTLFCVYAPLFRRPDAEDARVALDHAGFAARAAGVRAIGLTPPFRGPAAAIAWAADETDADVILMLGDERRSAIRHALRRRLIRSIRRRLAKERTILLYD